MSCFSLSSHSIYVNRLFADYQVLPFVTPLAFLFLLPSPSSFSSSSSGDIEAAYSPIPTIVVDDGETQAPHESVPEDLSPTPPVLPRRSTLSGKDKWRLVRPLLWKFMAPLCKLSYISSCLNQRLIYSL